MEIWKPIEGYETLYQISNYGNIKNNNGRYLKPFKNNKGYLMIRLYKNTERKVFLVHRLVATHFIPNPNNLPEVNHKDENPSNPIYTNLEWCDKEYNMNYGTIKERISQKLKGRTFTQEQKYNISKGHEKEIIQLDTNNVLLKIWSSAKDAEQQTKINRCHISEVCKGKRKTAGGYIWKYNN